MLQLTFKQTQAEMMVRSAATILFNKLFQESSIVELSELAESPQYGLTASATSEPVGPKFVRITDLKDGGINWATVPFCRCEDAHKYALEADDILFVRTGATTGKTHLVQKAQNAVFASYLIRLRPKKEVSANYLYSFFQSDLYWLQILEEKKGSAQPNVNGKKLVTIRLPIVEVGIQHAVSNFLEVVRRRQDGSLESLPELPSPIAEQRRIVARIEELAAKIEEARGLREGAIEKLDIFSRLAPSQVFENLVSDTKLLPIGEVISFRNDLIRPTDGKTGKLRFIGLQHVESHSGNRIGEDKLDAESLQGRKFKFSPGEIIYGYLRPYLNKVWVADCDGICSVDQYVIRGNPDKVDVNYLAHFMRSQTFLSQAIDLTHNLQLPRLRTALLEGIKIPLPSLSQQRSLVDYLNNLQLQIKRVKQFREDALQEFDALLPAILDKAFKGEL